MPQRTVDDNSLGVLSRRAVKVFEMVRDGQLSWQWLMAHLKDIIASGVEMQSEWCMQVLEDKIEKVWPTDDKLHNLLTSLVQALEKEELAISDPPPRGHLVLEFGREVHARIESTEILWRGDTARIRLNLVQSLQPVCEKLAQLAMEAFEWSLNNSLASGWPEKFSAKSSMYSDLVTVMSALEQFLQSVASEA
jgi:hypothetical protein